MTSLSVLKDEVGGKADPQPQPKPQPRPNDPRPTVPWGPHGPRYSPHDLLGEVYFGLWSAGNIPPGPMVDPDGAVKACADLLRAFGVTPTGSPDPVETQRAALAVAAVCAVAA